MQHIEFSAFVEPTLVVFVQALKRVFDACKVRNPPIDGLQQVEHRQKRAVERGNVIVIERQFGRSSSDFLAIFHEFLDATDFRERRSHRADAPSTDFRSVGGQFLALAQTATAHVNDDFETFGLHRHPTLGQLHSLLGREHIALARRTVDKHAFQPIFVQHFGISLDGFKVDVAIRMHRCKRCIDQSNNLFHNPKFFI